MGRLPRQLNPEILRDRLPENYRVVLEQAETNVNRAVEEVIQGYEKNLGTLAKQLEDGKFPEEFQRDVDGLFASFDAQVSGLGGSIDEIKKLAERLAAEKKPSSQDLNSIAKALSEESSKLETRLKEAREKARKVGDASGKVLGSALRKMVTGGI